MILNTTVITNSEYSRNAIFEAYGIDDITVINPPIDINTFRNSSLVPSYLSSSSSSIDKKEYEDNYSREDIVLVVSRIEPSKEIENAIRLAKLLNENTIGKEMIIVGSLDSYYNDYYTSLQKMITESELESFVKFETDASLDRLLYLMKKSKVYFHPRPGEHFGMSIVEAMSAGLIPVVPSIGGPSEFVPLKYQYHTLQQALQIVKSAFNVPVYERMVLSNHVEKFSTSNYIKQFQNVIHKLLVKP
jgi:glycosyltransferase involved in cell wall biosynthesis